MADRSTGHDAGLAALSLGALGIVFGDIGTSPLYAFRESFGETDVAVVEGNILGVLSLIFWSLILVITIKYLVFVMRADNEGEGGILALTVAGRPHPPIPADAAGHCCSSASSARPCSTATA